MLRWELEEDGRCERGDAGDLAGISGSARGVTGAGCEGGGRVQAGQEEEDCGMTGTSAFVVCAVLGGGGGRDRQAGSALNGAFKRQF